MPKELKEILLECMREAGSIEDLAERLIAAGVSVPEANAKCEIRNAELRVAEEIFAEIDKKLDDITIVMGALDSLRTFHKTIEKVTAELAELKKKYTESEKDNGQI